MDNWRIVVLGDSCVGKTALSVQFTLNCFVEAHEPTIEDAYRKQLVVDNRMSFIEMLDTAGSEEYATLRDHEGQAFIIVYSITSQSSFNRLDIFRQTVERVAQGNPQGNPLFILVGNKCDRTNEREVTRAEGAALARRWGCQFFETSAKTTQGVDILFMDVVRTLRLREPRRVMQPDDPLLYLRFVVIAVCVVALMLYLLN